MKKRTLLDIRGSRMRLANSRRHRRERFDIATIMSPRRQGVGNSLAAGSLAGSGDGIFDLLDQMAIEMERIDINIRSARAAGNSRVDGLLLRQRELEKKQRILLNRLARSRVPGDGELPSFGSNA